MPGPTQIPLGWYNVLMVLLHKKATSPTKNKETQPWIYKIISVDLLQYDSKKVDIYQSREQSEFCITKT